MLLTAALFTISVFSAATAEAASRETGYCLGVAATDSNNKVRLPGAKNNKELCLSERARAMAAKKLGVTRANTRFVSN